VRLAGGEGEGGNGPTRIELVAGAALAKGDEVRGPACIYILPAKSSTSETRSTALEKGS
jgi:hypothetical protein